jgi:protein involved in polysaccharide export with SLBB domain
MAHFTMHALFLAALTLFAASPVIGAEPGDEPVVQQPAALESKPVSDPAGAPAVAPADAAPGAQDAGTGGRLLAYTLYPGDLIEAKVFDNPDLDCRIRIPTDGCFTFPLIGDVTGLVGRTIGSLTKEVTERLEKDYLQQAVVTITVLEFATRPVYIYGSVAKADAIGLDPFAPTTALQAISKVGGFLDDANRAAAQVIRDDPSTPGRKMSLAIPGNDAVTAMTDDVTLQPGDIIIVPRLDRIYIIGRVNRPGAVNLPTSEELTVSKAVSLAGGFDRFSKQDEVQLIRLHKPVQTVDVEAILSGDRKKTDPKLEAGDTVYVPETRF